MKLKKENIVVSKSLTSFYKKINSIKKQIDTLESDRKTKFGGDYAKRVNLESDPEKRKKLMIPIIDITKKINEKRKELVKLLEKEEEYITKAGSDAELDSKFADGMYEHSLKNTAFQISESALKLYQLLEKYDKSNIKVPKLLELKLAKAKNYIDVTEYYLESNNLKITNK